MHSSITIQITPESRPATPTFMGEAAAFAQVFTHVGILKAIQERVRFARARFGTSDLIDFVVVLIASALSGEPTLLTFSERFSPFAGPFMALFGRNQLPHRSTLSRFLAALDQPTVEALCKLFQADLVARKPFASPGGMVDRTGLPWWVVDVDGTRATATNEHHPKNDICSAKVADRVDIHLSEMDPGKIHEYPRKERIERWQFHDFRNTLLDRIASPRHDEKANGIFIERDTKNGKHDEAHERFPEEGNGNW